MTKLFDSPETVLKKQTINVSQKNQIKLTLVESKYSKLKYNQIKILVISVRNVKNIVLIKVFFSCPGIGIKWRFGAETI